MICLIWFVLFLLEIPIENISAHTKTLWWRLAFAAFPYRALHAMKRGLGFQDLIRLLDYGLFCLTFENTSVRHTLLHCIKRRRHWRWGLINLDLCYLLQYSSGEDSLLCLTCYDTSPRLTRSHPEDRSSPRESHLTTSQGYYWGIIVIQTPTQHQDLLFNMIYTLMHIVVIY